jgi:hypothetical protein
VAALSLAASASGSAEARAPAQSASLNGVWTSVGCEARQGGPFAQRLLRLANGAYELDLTLFADGKCTIPTLALTYAGGYRLGGPSASVPGATDITFTILNASAAPLNTSSAELLNTAPPNTCGANPWNALVEQDLVPTNGCSVLGINLAGGRTQYDIEVIRDGQLYLGQGVGAGGNLNTPALRPTELGPPLTRQGEASSVVLLPESGADLTHRRR